MTFKEIQDYLLLQSQELQGLTDYNLPIIKFIINRVYLDIVKKTKCIEDNVDITTVANQFSYSITDSANLAYIYKPYLVRYIRSGIDENGEKLTPYSGGYSNLPENRTYGTPKQYWIRGLHTRSEIEFGTIPICATTGNTIRISAFMFPLTKLTLDANEPLIKDAWQDALFNGSLAKIYGIYSHLNKNWRDKALKYEVLYKMDMDLANEDMFTDSDDQFPEVQDAYAKYDNWE